MFVLASVVGFMGPFGTYFDDGLVGRITHWWMLLMGAYLLVRPALTGLAYLARRTGLPETPVAFWGGALLSLPLAVIWRTIGQNEFRELDGYAGLVPFSLLCAFVVMGVHRWALKADRQIDARPTSVPAEAALAVPELASAEPPLRRRLSPSFNGSILALQSEDHYVRVHGHSVSELLLIRMRDAISEMDGVSGEQVHRSWWVARDGVASTEPAGRSWRLTLKNGLSVPVARDSVSRLKRTGLLQSSAIK